MLIMSEDQSLHDTTKLLWENTNSEKQKNEKVEGVMNKKRNRELNKISSAEGNGDHEMHIWTERERRKKMKNMFASLHALLPHLPSKVRFIFILRLIILSFPSFSKVLRFCRRINQRSWMKQ